MHGMTEKDLFDQVRLGGTTITILPDLLEYRSPSMIAAETSTLGLRPGQWPSGIVVKMDQGPLKFLRGDKMFHLRTRKFLGYEYELVDGRTRVAGQKLYVFEEED